ncbi:alkaline phosphatase, tissue-nonspecific isozyme-like [Acanthaster planci]|uniref:alkaline phosphatase n=1 Tax=Acanthaster planci TaxID=133434 RepID=A0A8B7XR31_ACAPL|nr:alkaline phosphatase, tissue-nonspecific isozyme-like [Acanthaster planci]
MASKAVFVLVCLVATCKLTIVLGADSGTCDVNINKPRTPAFEKNLKDVAVEAAKPDYWRKQARETMKNAIKLGENLNKNTAKSIVLFIGDGMSIPTAVGARILKGQKNDMPGEEGFLSFEKFPYVGMSKTYNVDMQVPDCASTATAILTGVKTKSRVVRSERRCGARGLLLGSRCSWSTGIVTTDAIVGNTPAAAYAHSPNAEWKLESPTGCAVDDIAKQFVGDGVEIDVALGGGRYYFMMDDQPDPADSGVTGGRRDADLIEAWKTKYGKLGSMAYVTDKAALQSLSTSTDYVLGLFSRLDMSYNEGRSVKEPSLSEMVEKALQLLQNKNQNYLLLVEGAHIDTGHRQNKVGRALHETLAMDKAVEKVVSMTSDLDTMVIVTADHGHTMTMAGYPCRGQNVLGKVYAKEEFAQLSDGRSYTTFGYANGPSAVEVQKSFVEKGGRPIIDDIDTEDLDYQAQSLVPLAEETNGGEDVQIFASGPHAHLAQGVHEQSYINTLMTYGACLGRYKTRTGC